MKKAVLVILLSIVGVDLLHLWAFGAIDAIDIAPVEELLREIDAQYGEYFGWQYFSDLLRSEQGLNIADIFSALLKFIQNEIRMDFALCGRLLFLAILSAILGNLQQAFGQSIGELARLTVFFLAVLLVMDEARHLYEIALGATGQLVKFMDVILPTELVLLFVSGGVSTAGVLEPLMFWIVNLSGNLAKNMLLPGIYFCLILAIINAMSDKYKLSKLEKLFKRVLLGVFSGINSIFLLILSVSGASMAMTDGLGLRGMKYVAGTFIPIVGDMLANTAELTAAGALFLKNGFGIIGLFIIVLLAFLPAVKILTAALLLKLTAALIEPIGEDMLSELYQSIGECLVLMFAAVMLVGLMFFLSTAVLVAVSQTILMLR